MKCELIQPELLDYSRGLLSRSDSEEIKCHISSCAECAALLAEEAAFDLKLASVPEELPANDVWALVRAGTKPRRFSPAVLLSGAFGDRLRGLVAAVATTAAVIGVFYGMMPAVTEQPSYQPDTRVSTAVTAADEPLAHHTDAMIDVIEDM